MKQILKTLSNCLIFKLITMKKVILLIAVLFSLSACMKFELPQEKTTTEQGSNKDTNGKTDKTEDQPAKPDPDEEEQYGTGVKLTPKSEYEKIPLASMPVLGDQTLPESYMLPIPDWTGSIDQGRFGTCLANSIGMSLTIEVSNKKRKIPYEQRDLAYFSPAFLYSLGRLPGNCASAGMTVDGAMEVVKTYGVCPIKYMPYNKQVCPSARPSAEAYKIASKTKIRGYQRAPLEEEKLKQLVYSGKPVLLVVEVNNGFKKAFFKGGIWRRGETPKGNNLHAILLTGYTPTALIALNSWGPGASGRGIINISPEMLGDFVLQAYIIDTYQSYPPLDDIENQEDDTPKPEPQKIQVSKPELNFSVTTIGQRVKQTLEVELVSGDDTPLSLNLSDPSNFEVKEKEINLFKGIKKVIEVWYTPKTPASNTASLTLMTSGGFNYKVRLYAEAKQPEPERDNLVIDIQTIDFGSIQLQQGSSTKSFKVTNNNNQTDVSLTLSSNTDAYTVSPEKVTISPRNTQTITVRLNVRGEGYYPGSIRVQSTRGYEERIQLSAQVEKRNDDRQDDHDQGDRDHDRDRDNERDRDQQRGTTKYIVKEERPKVNLEADYCGRGSMGITYAGVIGIDEQGSEVKDLGSQLEVKIKVIKIDNNKIFTHYGEIFHKKGKDFCTKIFDSNTYNGGSSAIYTKTFKVNKGGEDNTVWILCVSNNGYRFYTKVRIIEQR